MKISLIIFFIFLFFFNGYSQLLEEYNSLKNEGAIPNVFYQLKKEKITSILDLKISNEDTKKISTLKEKYYAQLMFELDNLFLSGRIVFGSQTNKYINNIASKLLVHNKNLDSTLQFYLIRSNKADAFSTSLGQVFITTGLINQLETEAQLAFIIANEIIYCTNNYEIPPINEISSRINHSVINNTFDYDKFINKDFKLRNQKPINNSENELMVLELLFNANYNITSAVNFIEILQYSHLPFDISPFDFKQFESDNFKINKNLLLDSLTNFSLVNFEYSDFSLQKNLLNKYSIFNDLKSKFEDNGAIFFQEEGLFNTIIKHCQFESIELDLIEGNYVKAIYNSHILLEQNQNSNYLKKSICKSMYAIAKFSFADKYFRIASPFIEYDGNISKVYYFFEKMSPVEILSFSIRYLWIQNDDLKDAYIDRLIENLISDLVSIETIKWDQYYRKLPDIVINDVKDSTLIDTSYTYINKYAKIKEIKKNQELKIDTNHIQYYKTSFLDIPNFDALEIVFSDIYKEHIKQKEISKEIDSKYSNLSAYNKYKQIEKENKKSTSNYPRVKKDFVKNKVLYIEPSALVFHEKSGYNIFKSESQKLKYFKHLTKLNKVTKMQNEILSVKLMNSGDVEKLNDLISFQDWTFEKNRIEAADSKWNFILLESEYVMPLSKKYNTQFICQTEVNLSKYKRNFKGVAMGIGLFTLVLLPASIYYVSTPTFDSSIKNVIFDIENGKIVTDLDFYIYKKLKKEYVKSYSYDALLRAVIYNNQKKK